MNETETQDESTPQEPIKKEEQEEEMQEPVVKEQNMNGIYNGIVLSLSPYFGTALFMMLRTCTISAGDDT